MTAKRTESLVFIDDMTARSSKMNCEGFLLRVI